jgi:hypothetical protein
MRDDSQVRRLNRRHALRFPVETHKRERVLIEQRVMRVLVWIVGLLAVWPMIAADKYVSSARYNQAKYIESVDAGIWIGAIALQVAWLTSWLLILMRLSTGGGT